MRNFFEFPGMPQPALLKQKSWNSLRSDDYYVTSRTSARREHTSHLTLELTAKVRIDLLDVDCSAAFQCNDRSTSVSTRSYQIDSLTDEVNVLFDAFGSTAIEASLMRQVGQS